MDFFYRKTQMNRFPTFRDLLWAWDNISKRHGGRIFENWSIEITFFSCESLKIDRNVIFGTIFSKEFDYIPAELSSKSVIEVF